MNKAQKAELIRLIGAVKASAMEYGIVYSRTARGEYVRRDVVDASQKALNNALRGIYEYLDTIE